MILAKIINPFKESLIMTSFLRWLTANKISLNDDKTELIHFRKHLPYPGRHLRGSKPITFRKSNLPSGDSSFRVIPLIAKIAFFLNIWNVKKSTDTDLVSRTTCLRPVAPGPMNLPKTVFNFFVSSVVPALTSKYCSSCPQQSSRFPIVTLVMVTFLFNCIRSHGSSSFLERKPPSPPFQAYCGP